MNPPSSDHPLQAYSLYTTGQERGKDKTISTVVREECWEYHTLLHIAPGINK